MTKREIKWIAQPVKIASFIVMAMLVLLVGCSSNTTDEALDTWFEQNPASCNVWTGDEVDKPKYLKFVQSKSGTDVSRVAIWRYLDEQCK